MIVISTENKIVELKLQQLFYNIVMSILPFLVKFKALLKCLFHIMMVQFIFI